MSTPSPLYEEEVRDLLSIIDALNKPMSTDQPKTAMLYIDAMEVTVGMNDGDNDVFTIWWDSESECFRVKQKVATS